MTDLSSGAPRLASAGARFRAAVAAEKPLQIVGTINAYHARLAERSGYKAIYLSGGGVAAGSLGLPDLGISNLDDVLTDVRRITDQGATLAHIRGCERPAQRKEAARPGEPQRTQHAVACRREFGLELFHRQGDHGLGAEARQ